MTGRAVAALVVLAVVSVLWTIMLVLVPSELPRASWRLQEALRSLELELKPTIRQVREAIRTLNRAGQGAAEGTERVRETLATLEAVGDNIRTTTRVVRAGVGSRLLPVASLVAGVRVGATVAEPSAPAWRCSLRRSRGGGPASGFGTWRPTCAPRPWPFRTSSGTRPKRS